MTKEKRDGTIEQKVLFNLISGKYNWKLLFVDNFLNFDFLSSLSGFMSTWYSSISIIKRR